MGAVIEKAAVQKPKAKPANMELQRLLTVAEVADFLRCSRQAVYNWVEHGELPHFKIGRLVRFSLVEVEAYIAARHRAGGSVPW